MNLKLKRLVRTASSEQYALFDLAQTDDQQQPLTIGKLDLHYTNEGVYGTILLWDDMSRRLDSGRRRAFIHALLGEIAQPMGVPNEYVVEFFAPDLDGYELFHNIGSDEDDYEDDYEEDVEEYKGDDEAAPRAGEQPSSPAAQAAGDHTAA